MSIDLNSDPEVYCVTCGRTMKVREVAGYAPNVFKNRLKRECRMYGCKTPIPMYRPGGGDGTGGHGQGAA